MHMSMTNHSHKVSFRIAAEGRDRLPCSIRVENSLPLIGNCQSGWFNFYKNGTQIKHPCVSDQGNVNEQFVSKK